MIRVLFISALFVCMQTNLWAQQMPKDKAWELLLHDIKINDKYSEEYGDYVPVPVFGKKLSKLNSTVITVSGFFLPTELTGDLVILSYNPLASCFFCTGSGIETIVELDLTPDQRMEFKAMNADRFLVVRGVLELNHDDYNHLFYVLHDVVLME